MGKRSSYDQVEQRIDEISAPALSASTIHRYEKAERLPDASALVALARAYKTDEHKLFDALIADIEDREHLPTIDELLSNNVPPPLPTNVEGFSRIPLLAGRIAAGDPLEIKDAEFVGELAFRDDFVSKRGVPVCVRVGQREESMVPFINPGDVVVLECDPKKIQGIRDDRIYAVRIDGGATLKRLEIIKEHGSAWLACISDNLDKVKYKTRLFPVAEGQSWLDYVIGEVVWRGQYVGGRR